jgi:hypothetical protein
MNKTIFIAAMLAVATVLAAGLTVLPSAVQEAQANPCSLNAEASSGDADNGGNSGSASSSVTHSGNQNCEFTGPVEFDED